MIKIVQILVLLLVTSSCSGQNDLKEYYYPIGQKAEVHVYKYVDKVNPNNIEYWKVTTDPQTRTILTESFTTDFRLYNIFEEQLDDEGAKVIGYTDFQINKDDSSTQIDGNVIDQNVYGWNGTNKYRYSVNYLDPSFGRMQFVKERTQNGFENIEIFKTEYETAKFKDEYEMKLLDTNENYEFYQYTYYGKNTGMVKYERFLPDGTSKQLELEQIISEVEFEQLKEESVNN